jgi:N-acetylmuramoyl-L-alanine amidase
VRQELGARRPDISFDIAPVAPVAATTPGQVLDGAAARRRTIVVDAGHGGHDPGAVGATGVREKDVVLDAALQLRDALESRGRYMVALTRDADRFVELEDRVRFARAQNADLFISIHADSHTRTEASGASVYTLSERGATRAQSIMAAQNWDIDLGEAPRSGVVGDILVDLAQRETTNRSAQFAETLIPRLGQASPLLTNTHRNAGFFVLLAPDVPAVLIETGFLSNPADERRLSDPRARQAMAEAMAGAVDAYFQGPRLYAARA